MIAQKVSVIGDQPRGQGQFGPQPLSIGQTPHLLLLARPLTSIGHPLTSIGQTPHFYMKADASAAGPPLPIADVECQCWMLMLNANVECQ